MRYLINDDDIEDWIVRLKKVTGTISAGENEAHSTLDYVISEMEREVQNNLIDIKRRIDNQKNQ